VRLAPPAVLQRPNGVAAEAGVDVVVELRSEAGEALDERPGRGHGGVEDADADDSRVVRPVRVARGDRARGEHEPSARARRHDDTDADRTPRVHTHDARRDRCRAAADGDGGMGGAGTRALG